MARRALLRLLDQLTYRWRRRVALPAHHLPSFVGMTRTGFLWNWIPKPFWRFVAILLQQRLLQRCRAGLVWADMQHELKRPSTWLDGLRLLFEEVAQPREKRHKPRNPLRR